MSFFFRQDQERAAAALSGRPIAPGPLTGFGENFEAAAAAMRRTGLLWSEESNLTEAFDEHRETIQRLTGKELPNPMVDEIPEAGDSVPSSSDPFLARAFEAERARQRTPAAKIAWYWQQVNTIRGEQPNERRLMIETAEQMQRRIVERARAAEEKAADVASRATLLGTVGAFAGAAKEGLADPINLATLPLGAPTALARSAASAIIRTAAVEGVINAFATGLAQPDVQAYRAELGLPAGAAEALQEIALAGAAGSVLGGGLAAAGRSPEAVRALLGAFDKLPAKRVAEIFRRTVKNPTPEQRAALDMLDREAEIAASRPTEASPAAGAAHRARLEEATRRASDGLPVHLTGEAEPATPAVSRETVQRWVEAPEQPARQEFLASDVGSNAKRWQYKLGGDAEGVVETLRGVKQWDPILAGEIIVYRYRDGRVEVIDGHQRLGLAKRLMAEGHKPINVWAMVLDEADYAIAEARARASFKNLASQEPRAPDVQDLEAAKLIREIGAENFELLRDVLPPAQGRIRLARAALALSDEAFRQVINGQVPLRYAVPAGLAAPNDPGLQLALLGAIRAEDPENLFQAEAIVQAAMAAGATREQQLDLLGERTVTTLLLGARAKVLDAALKELKRDARVFRTLSKERETIEAAGNELATATNERRAEINGQAAEILQALATRTGPIADELKRLSAAAHASGRYAPAGRELAQLVAGEIERTGVVGIFGRGERGVSGLAAAVERAAVDGDSADTAAGGLDDPSLTLFDEPLGKGAAEQATAIERQVRSEIGLEAAQADDELEDLARQVDAGASPDELINHPAIGRALERMEAVPPTADAPGFGTPEWEAARAFNVDGRAVTGYEAGVGALLQKARAYAGERGVASERQATIVLGPPAAGKSSIAEPIAEATRSAIVDADDAKAALPEYEGGIGAPAVHEESSVIAGRVLEQAADAGDNLVLPLVGAKKASILARMELLRAAGYRVTLVNMAVDPDEAFRRMIRRFLSTGRLIDPTYARGVAAEPSRVYMELKERADEYAQIDNNGSLATGPHVTEDSTGSLARVLERPRGGDRPAPARGAGEGGGQTQGEAGQEGRADLDAPAEAGTDPTLRDLEIPEGVALDPSSGEAVVTTRKLGEVLDEIAADREFVDQLDLCLGGRS